VRVGRSESSRTKCASLSEESHGSDAAGVGAYRGWRQRLVLLLGELRADLDVRDAGWYADMLLASVDAQLYAYQRRELKFSERRIATNAKALASAIAGNGSRP
jgi:hypothetical protein